MTDRTLLKLVLDGIHSGHQGPIATFVEWTASGQYVQEQRTFNDLLQKGTRFARFLKKTGMASGDSFAIVLRNHPEFVEAMVGSEIARTIFVPIDPRTRAEKLSFMLRLARCRGAIVSADVAPYIEDVRPTLPQLEWVRVIGHERGDEDRMGSKESSLDDAALRMEPAAPETPMQMLFTSGTTGDPKAILSPCSRFAYVASLGPMLGFRPGDRLYTGLSLTHANAQLITLGIALANRFPVVLSRQFSKSRLWELLIRYGCTCFNLLGGMATAIYAEPPGPFDRAHSVRFVLSAGMPKAMWRGFEERFGVEIFEFFGTAEGGLLLNPPGEGPVGSVGRAPAGSVCEILDEGGSVMPSGRHGEICMRGSNGTTPPVTYFGNPHASSEKTRGGWFHTGDIGWKDDEGWVYFSHRDGHSIRRNGAFLDPREIETTLASLKGVADVYVYGVRTVGNAPGEKEVVAAVVADRDCDPQELIKACARRLGSGNSPTFIQFVQRIPKTASEKPQERHLIDLLTSDDARVFDSRGPHRITLQ